MHDAHNFDPYEMHDAHNFDPRDMHDAHNFGRLVLCAAMRRRRISIRHYRVS